MSYLNRIISDGVSRRGVSPYRKTGGLRSPALETSFLDNRDDLDEQNNFENRSEDNPQKFEIQNKSDLGGESTELDLAERLNRVQVERLQRQLGVRDVPCSDESQMRSRLGGDSEEQLHDISVNGSSIVRKRKSSAENEREKVSGSEFVESSFDVSDSDENVTLGRSDSNGSFYDRKVELNMDQINDRESKSSIEVDDINLRSNQGQRTLPGLNRENANSDRDDPFLSERTTEDFIQSYISSKTNENKKANLGIANLEVKKSHIKQIKDSSNKSTKVDGSHNEIQHREDLDMERIYSELRTAVNILSKDERIQKEEQNKEGNDDFVQKKIRSLRAEKRQKDLFGDRDLPSSEEEKKSRIHETQNLQRKSEIKSKENKRKNKASKSAADSSNSPLQPKVTIGQIDVVITAPESQEKTGYSDNASNSRSAFGGGNSSRSYLRRI